MYHPLLFILLLGSTQFLNAQPSGVVEPSFPEILRMSDGSLVKSVPVWENKRRSEILDLFERNVYGKMPTEYDTMVAEVTREDAGAMAGKARLREVTITVWKGNRSVPIHLILFTPTVRNKASVFLFLNNRDAENTDPTRRTKSGFWPAEMVIDSGYAVAAFQVGDAAPDNKDTYREGVMQLYPEQWDTNHGMKAIGSWAWAASRVLDYFHTTSDIEATQVNLVGHSRGGKAALWAAAQDQRFAMVFSSCSGNTGAALARRDVGESVKAINTAFPHWFCDEYKTYNDHVDALPVDQHMLIALLAPRPVYTTSATQDIWADPVGSYHSILLAQKAYALYQRKSNLAEQLPPANTPLIQSVLGYHIREGIHDLTPYDWSHFIQFANYHYAIR